MLIEKAKMFDIPEVVTDYEKILSRCDIDIVDNITCGNHQDMVFETIETGKHCLAEKPVCRDYWDVCREGKRSPPSTEKRYDGTTVEVLQSARVPRPVPLLRFNPRDTYSY